MGCKASKVIQPEPIIVDEDVQTNEDDENYDSDLTDEEDDGEGAQGDDEGTVREMISNQGGDGGVRNIFRRKKKPNEHITGLEYTMFGYEGLYDGFINKKGLVDGHGIWKREGGGEYFKGEFVKGKICGSGKFTFSDGSYYDGSYYDGKKNGYGIEKNILGSTFAWDAEERDYNGTYEGEFILGKRQGKGIQTFVNGDTYEGSWLKNKKHGQGKFTYNNKNNNSSSSGGGSYEGEYQNNERNGYGILIYPNGNVYEGEFVDGVPDGKGIEKNTNGIIYHDGLWSEGRPSKEIDNRINNKNAMSEDPIPQIAPHGRNEYEPPKPWSKPAP